MQAVIKILISLGMQLLKEAVLKKVIVIGLEKIAKETETDADDKLVKVVKEAWGE